MAARGSESKEKITQQILNAFNGSFIYDKEIRIPIVENGEVLQIKCVLTCAKTNVDCGSDVAIPGSSLNTKVETKVEVNTTIPKEEVKITEEEKNNIKSLMNILGL